MKKIMILSENFEERKFIIQDELGEVLDFYIDKIKYKKYDNLEEGSFYLGRVVKILSGIEAAFIDIGESRSAFLHVLDIFKPSKEEELILTEEKKDSQQMIIPDDYTMISDRIKRLKKYAPTIDSLLKEGDKILVQIDKEPIASKGARVTTHLSFTGQYLIYYPYFHHTFLSERIENIDERIRLTQQLDFLREEFSGGILAKSSAQGQSLKNLKKDFLNLLKQWENLLQKFNQDQNPKILLKETSFIGKILKEYLDHDLVKIICDSPSLIKQLKKLLPDISIEYWKESKDLFESRHLDVFLKNLFKKKIELTSGVSFHIEQTEALVSVDINSGRFTKDNIQETALYTNLEAAREIAKHIRWRNLGGIIVIDFIDMESSQDKRLVEKTFLEELKKDRTKISVLPISEYGLLQMTRKRKSDSVHRLLTENCSCCHGYGYVKIIPSVAYDILKKIKNEFIQEKNKKNLRIFLNHQVCDFILNNQKNDLRDLEKSYQKTLVFNPDSEFHRESFEFHWD